MGEATIPLATWLPRLATTRVLCVGDVMLDRFVRGSVARVSPEAPIPVLRVETDSEMLGGAGNVLRNLTGLGAKAGLAAVVGDDAPGAALRALLAEQAGAAAHLQTEAGRQTTVKTRFLAGGQQLLRADREDTRPIAPATAAALRQEAAAALADCGALVLSDYGKGVLDDDLLAALIAAAAAAGRPVVVDPKGRDYGRYRGAAVVTPNRAELAAAAGTTLTATAVDDDDAVAAAAAGLREAAGLGAVLVTRSERGMTLVDAAGAVTQLKAQAREVYDVSGAGDTVVAVLAAALAAGAPLADAARLANIAAGVVVGKVGTAPILASELRLALHEQEVLAGEAKIVTAEAMLDRVAVWRRDGWRIGFTNGVFDLLHPGHLSLLRQAKDHCDRLVVALNSDASVRRLKGDSRPVQSQAARAQVLASLAAVDLVVAFEENTPLALIEAIRPDLLVKGADYRIDQVVGADIVQAAGGRVLLAELAPGHSTTATIARLNDGE